MREHLYPYLLHVAGIQRHEPNPYKALLKHGMYFSPATKPENIPWGTKKLCFCNAARLAIENPDYVYCEGYAIPAKVGVPLHHAWVYDTVSGRIIDHTWRDGGTAYWGVPFEQAFLALILCKKERYGDLIYSPDFYSAEDNTGIINQLVTNKKQHYGLL